MKLEIAVDDSSMRKVLDAAPRRGVDAFDAATFRRAQDALDAADPLTPRKSGKLWGSRFATRTSPVTIGFSIAYAAARHERHAAQWKFLEHALLRIAREGVAPLAKHFAAAFDAGETLASAPARHPQQPKGGG